MPQPPNRARRRVLVVGEIEHRHSFGRPAASVRRTATGLVRPVAAFGPLAKIPRSENLTGAQAMLNLRVAAPFALLAVAPGSCSGEWPFVQRATRPAAPCRRRLVPRSAELHVRGLRKRRRATHLGAHDSDPGQRPRNRRDVGSDGRILFERRTSLTASKVGVVEMNGTGAVFINGTGGTNARGATFTHCP